MSCSRTFRVWTVLVGVTLAAACGGGDSGGPTAPPTVPDPPRATSVTVSPTTAELDVGETVQLTAVVRDQNSNVMAGASVTWMSGAGTVATVNASGLVTGVAGGTATITARSGSAQGTAEITVGPNPDRAALVALYEATDGPNWVNSDNWLTDAPLGNWYGVDTDRHGRVIRVSLRGYWNSQAKEQVNHGLSGPIPPELGDLSNLTELALQFNALTGPIPPELGDLTNLQDLFLFHNQLSGSIPPELSNLTNLQSLQLWANRLTGSIPPQIGDLTNLRVLDLGGNPNMTGDIPSELGGLANLTVLSLEGNTLTGPIPPQLGQLSQLEDLTVHWNQLRGPIPPELGNLANLSRLLLQGNREFTGALPTTLAGLAALKRLEFNHTGLCAPHTTEFQLWLQGLELVEGENCEIVQAGERETLAAIYQWTNGEGWLNRENWLNDGPLNNWHGVTADSTDKVIALDLSENNLTGILPEEAGSLVDLTDLVLNGNGALGGELPVRILELVSLSTLRLDGTGLCVPAAAEFRYWLERIEDARAGACPDDHVNDATGATRVALGGRTQGELESYRDEDWFQVETGVRGRLTLETEGDISVLGEMYDSEGTRVGYDDLGQNAFISRHLTPGTYYLRVTGQNARTRGSYALTTSFEPRPPGGRVYLTQATQSHDFEVPLLAGEDALLRVFVMADSGVTATMPPVRARFYRGVTETHSVRIDGSSARVPHTMAEGDLEATANAVVPGSILVPGAEMVVEVDPDGTLDRSLGIGGRIPAEGRMTLDVRSMPDFHVTAVPFLWAENPDSSGVKATVGLTAEHDVFYETRDWLPVAAMEVTVRESVLVDYDPREEMNRTLGDTDLLRVADGASGYYMGVPPWNEGGVLGIARLGGKSSVSRFEGHTVAHEFGHNFSLHHVACGRPAGIDGAYPHIGGRIGAWGYDFRHGTLVDPDVFTDLMTYCRTNDWISDYSFAKALEHRAPTQAARASHVVEQVLVVRGGVTGGRLNIQPAFVLDAPPTVPEGAGLYRLVGSDAQGGDLFALRFGMEEIADVERDGDGGFTFAIPVRAEWAESLATITLTGPEGSVTLSGDDPTAPATALVLDAATGRIQAILHGSPGQPIAAAPPMFTSPGTVTMFTSPGTVTLFSRGIPGPEAWRR